MRDVIGYGGGKGGGSSHTHYEATDSLHSTSYARVLDLVSEGEILGLANGIRSVYLNKTPVQNADGTNNFTGVTVDFRTGTQAQDYIPGFPDVESEFGVNVELKYGTSWVHAIGNTALSAIRITLSVPALSKADTSNGDILGYQVAYQMELSTDGGAYHLVLSNSFNGKTTSEYERTARIDLPPATTGWQVRVTRLTPNANTAAIADTTKIVSYTEVIDAKLRYPMSAIVGVQVDATQFQSVPTRAYDLLGRIIQVPSNYNAVTRAYTGLWDGTFKPSWTDNPAWIFRDLALNDRYGLGDRITSAQLDKWALYKIAQYCDALVPDGKGGQEPRFTCNLYLQSQKQAYAVLQDLASIFRGISYWGAGTIIASADMPSDPVYVYTAANVVGGKFTRAGSKASTRYTVALVTWNDPGDFYAQKTEYVEDPDGIKRYGIKQVQLTGFGCTSQGQAHRAGRWALATSRLETEGISFDVGMDGAIALPGQVVRIADPARMGRRVGGRIRTVNGRALTLDKAPAVNVGDALTAILPSGTSETHVVESVSGDTITVNADWSMAPRAQTVWSIDSNELSAPLARVLSVVEKDDVTFTLTVIHHEPGKYDYVERGIAITQHSQTALDVTHQAPPAAVTLAGYTVSLNDVQKLALQVSCAPVAGAVAYEGAYRRGNDNWVPIPRQASPTMDVRDVLAGTYTAMMAAVNSIGITSTSTMSVAVAIAADGVSKTAKIDLSADAPFFHTDQDGATTPTVITFTADLTALDGPVSFTCVGAKLSNVTATTAQLAFVDKTAASPVVTASVTAFDRTYSKQLAVGSVQDGAAGADGLKIAIARLFQWAPATPAKPTGKSTFTWPGTNSGYDGTDGWANPALGNPGTPGWRLFSASVSLQAAASATTSPVTYANAVIEDGAQNGASGINTRAATVYQWAATIPAGPTGKATFKWADGTFGAAPTNWTLTPGDAPSLGMTLFAATFQVTDTAANATTDFNWQSASVMAIGYVGTNGGPGQQGASYVTAYCATTIGTGTSAPAATKGKTSLPAKDSGGLTGTYSAAVPTLTAGQYQMQTDGIYDPSTDLITWSIPYQSSLKVATLSAITANLGSITGGSMNLGNGTFTVDNSGNLVCSSFKLVDPNTGEIILQAGSPLSRSYAPQGTLNTAISMGANGSLTGAGGGQVTITGLGYSGDLNATRGAPAGTTVGGTAAETVASNAASGASAAAAIPGINSSLNDKLSKSVASALQTQITLSTSGAIQVGNAAWSGAGFGGTGVVMTPYGIAGVAGGVPKFYIGTDGNPYFAGTLAAGIVKASNISIGSPDNVIPDPKFKDLTWWGRTGAPVGDYTGQDNGWLGGAILLIQPGGGAIRSTTTPAFATTPGATMLLQVQVELSSDFSGDFSVFFYVEGGGLYSMGCPNVGTWNGGDYPGWPIQFNGASTKGRAIFTQTITIPLNSQCANGHMVLMDRTVAGNVAVGSCSATRVTDATLLGQGVVQTKHLFLSQGGDISSGQTGFDTGNGFWIEGAGNGHGARMSIGSSTGSKIVMDPANGIFKLVNPQFQSSFSATITNTQNSYYWTVAKNSNGAFAGSYAANPANGVGGYSYSWSLSNSNAGIIDAWISGNTSNQQISLYVFGHGNTGEFDLYLQCTVTDVGGNVVRTVQQLTTVNFT